jgi:hypothetical protein
MTSGDEKGFVKLPNEQILFTSPPRTSLEITTPNQFPAASPLSIKSDGGIVYITNQRLVYLPTNPTTEFKSFSSPILHLQDTFVRAPFFGANYWVASCKPVSGGGIPPSHTLVDLKLTFKDGGAFDFHTVFEQIKERLYHAYQIARESGRAPVASEDLSNVNLEQLPAYEAPPEDDREESPPILSPRPLRPGLESANGPGGSNETPAAHPANFTSPDEPPPGYEEAQAQAVGNALNQRLRAEAERGNNQSP